MNTRLTCGLFLVMSVVAGMSQAQEPPAPHVGRVQDWSSRHIIVGGGLVAADLEAAKTEPRVLFHLAERNLIRLNGGRISPRDPENPAPDPESRHRFIDGTDVVDMQRRNLKIDWSLPLGTGVVAPYMFPAKFSFDINAAPSCLNDYVVFALNVAGVTGGQANIVAVNNLYSGINPGGLCGANPSIRWSYNGTTAAGGRVLTSPAISLDGTKMAYVESTATTAIFHILTLRPGGQGNSVTNAQAPTLNGSCTAATSCLKSVTYSSTATNTLASPWVDYQTDKAFVAGDNGRIYRISCVFTCALNANPTVDWSFTLPVAGTGGTQAQPGSPVYNFPYGLLIVSDQLGELWVLNAGGNTPSLFAGPVMIGGGGCTVTNPPGRTGTPAPCTANGGSFGIPDSVILDASGASQRIFAFTGNDGTAGASAVVAQLKQDLTAMVRVRVGRGSVGISPGVNLHNGTFDDKYFSVNPNTGKLFMCGTGAANTTPTHYWIGFAAYPTIDSIPTGSLQRFNVANLPCAPYTEIFNPNLNLGGQASHHDLLVSGLVGAGGNGWIITNDISLGNIPAGLNTVNYPGGVSGIVIDNISTAGQASSVYFTTQGVVTVGTCNNARCAVKLRQLNLQ